MSKTEDECALRALNICDGRTTVEGHGSFRPARCYCARLDECGSHPSQLAARAQIRWEQAVVLVKAERVLRVVRRRREAEREQDW